MDKDLYERNKAACMEIVEQYGKCLTILCGDCPGRSSNTGTRCSISGWRDRNKVRSLEDPVLLASAKKWLEDHPTWEDVSEVNVTKTNPIDKKEDPMYQKITEITVTTYRCSDGTEFDTRNEAEEYENQKDALCKIEALLADYQETLCNDTKDEYYCTEYHLFKVFKKKLSCFIANNIERINNVS